MNNSEIIKRLNELFEEAIIQLPDKEVLEDVRQNPNPAFQKHLNYIKRLNTIAKAEIQKGVSAKAKGIIESLINEIGKNELINQLFAQPKYKTLAPQLFSKFEGITEDDKESMLTDKKFMELVRELKKDMENEGNSEK